MKTRSKLLLILLANVLPYVIAVVIFLADDWTRWAVRDAIVHAATGIRPGHVLAAMCGVAIITSILIPFSTLLFEQIPYFRRRRLQEQSQLLREDRDRWKARFAEEVERRRQAETWRSEMEPLLEAERNANRNFNGRIAEAERNLKAESSQKLATD